MSLYYAGIGRRTIPDEIRESFERFGEFAQSQGFILRSGGADGADTAFEKYVRPENKEIYLPWRGFNGHTSKLFTPSKEAFSMAARFHPNWDNLSAGVQKLMARNVHQLLGLTLEQPVEFVVCWTENGSSTGGTGQGIKMAETLNIPVFNFGVKHFNKKELFEYIIS